MKSLRPKASWPWTVVGVAAFLLAFSPFWRPLNGILGPGLFLVWAGLFYLTHHDEFHRSNR